jgi:hypothetical protein
VRIVRIAMVVPVLALGLFAGCSDEPKEVPFKPTDTHQFDAMKEQMIKNVIKGGGKVTLPKTAKPAPAAPAPDAPAPAK